MLTSKTVTIHQAIAGDGLLPIPSEETREKFVNEKLKLLINRIEDQDDIIEKLNERRREIKDSLNALKEKLGNDCAKIETWNDSLIAQETIVETNRRRDELSAILTSLHDELVEMRAESQSEVSISDE